jgi:hypothetical protein
VLFCLARVRTSVTIVWSDLRNPKAPARLDSIVQSGLIRPLTRFAVEEDGCFLALRGETDN